MASFLYQFCTLCTASITILDGLIGLALLDLNLFPMNCRCLGFEAGRSVHPEEVAELRALLEEVPGKSRVCKEPTRCEPALIHFLVRYFSPASISGFYRSLWVKGTASIIHLLELPHLFQAIQDDSKHEESLGQLPFDQPQTYETNL